MKNVYMFSPNYLYGNDAYLPYPIGSLAAYAWSDEQVKQNYRLGGMFFTRQKIENVLAALDSPYICAFANYIWNFEYNKALAKAIKSKFPDCLIVFGGHQISETYARNHCKGERVPENIADIYIYDEGEIVFRDMLKTLLTDGNLALIPNLSYWTTPPGGGGGAYICKTRNRI